jgi:hypothetical protein
VDDPVEQPGVDPFWNSRLYGFVRGAFWIIFLVLPIITGWLAYDWQPNESFDERRHNLLDFSEIEDTNGNIGARPEVWEDKKTGEVISRADFKEHRGREARRMAAVWFAYGLIGCFAFAWARSAQGKSSFYDAFGRATLVNLASAAFTWLTMRF